MSYLYLDESGNLGYQLQTAGVSRHFVITILEIPDDSAKKTIEKAIERTLRNKMLGKRPPQRNSVTELKGAKTSFAIKQYFYRSVADIPFNLYSVILDKKRFINHLQFNRSRVYNFITHLVLKKLPLEQTTSYVMLTVDRSKSKAEIREFDAYLLNQLEARIPPQVPLIIQHYDSQENKLLQAVDLFAWGIFRKYEVGDSDWYDVFQKKIVYEQTYPFKTNRE
jgi:hypothetical protein